MRRFLFAILILFAACTPEATPFPVNLPETPTTTPPPTIPPPVRYALAANTEGFIADMDMIAAVGQVEQLADNGNDAELGVQYDIVAAYGDWSGWTRSTVMPHVSLVINTALTPLDNSLLANIVRRSIDPQAVVNTLDIPGAAADVVETSAPHTLRTELANLGWPDGFELAVGYVYTPGVFEISRQLKASSIENRPLLMGSEDVRAAIEAGRLHLALVMWTTQEERETWESLVGDANVIDLYIAPISYHALPELSITFTPGGWPIAAR